MIPSKVDIIVLLSSISKQDNDIVNNFVQQDDMITIIKQIF